jgi:hypothetical protein
MSLEKRMHDKSIMDLATMADTLQCTMVPTGVWALYYNDYGPIIAAVYPGELEARRNADPSFHHVVFLPWGKRIDEVVK